MTKIKPSAEAAEATAAANSTGAHTLTIKFPPKYEALYQALINGAEGADREVGQYVLLFLRDKHPQPKTQDEQAQ